MANITLPSWVKPMAELHATSVAEDELGLDPDTPEYDRAFEKAFYEFCEEFYTHSLIPYAANPSLPGKNAFLPFADILFRSSNSWAGIKGADAKEQEQIERMILRSVANIVKIYMKKSIVTSTGFGGAKGKEAMMERQEARYVRLAVTSMLMAMIKSIFDVDRQTMVQTVREFIADASFSRLNSTQAQQTFSAKIVGGTYDGVNMLKVLDAIKNQFGKKGFVDSIKEAKAKMEAEGLIKKELPKRSRGKKKSNPEFVEPEAPSIEDYVNEFGGEIEDEEDSGLPF